MRPRRKVDRSIQFYAQQARNDKVLCPQVTGGVNGGGWIRLAAAVGYVVTARKQARALLEKMYGVPPDVWLPPAANHAGWGAWLGAPVPENFGTWRGRPKFLVSPQDKDFYITREWREVRYQALKLSDGRCACCGRSKDHGVVLHVDHIKPKSKFPHLALTLSNLQVLCEDCNLGKSNKDDTDWAQLRADQEADKVIALAANMALNEGVRDA